MTGDTGNDRYTLIVLKEFFVDLADHYIHVSGCCFLRFGIAGEIQVVAAAVRLRRVTEITFHAQCVRPAMHDMVETILADVFGQHLQVSFGLVVLGTHGGHTDEQDSEKGGDHGNLSFMKHIEFFGSLR